MGRYYKVGTRTSPLALRQVEEVISSLRKFYPEFKARIIGIDTYGDKDKVTPISEVEGSDFFTNEIDKALLTDQIDFAVHSAKDLPDKLREGLTVAAITKSIDPSEVLVSKAGLTLDRLPFSAKIGTSSQRRKEGLKKYRGDFRVVDIRGNIEERLNILDNGELDAVVIAAAGLVRLDLKQRITQRISSEVITPHLLQGALALVTRREDSELIKLLTVIDSRETVSL